MDIKIPAKLIKPINAPIILFDKLWYVISLIIEILHLIKTSVPKPIIKNPAVPIIIEELITTIKEPIITFNKAIRKSFFLLMLFTKKLVINTPIIGLENMTPLYTPII